MLAAVASEVPATLAIALPTAQFSQADRISLAWLMSYVPEARSSA